eukprot:m.44582 g.44582  ORF g.44582 m.44582 type:complete len:57 (+) comp8556_c0_seq1:2969-3139(+)
MHMGLPLHLIFLFFGVHLGLPKVGDFRRWPPLPTACSNGRRLDLSLQVSAESHSIN